MNNMGKPTTSTMTIGREASLWWRGVALQIYLDGQKIGGLYQKKQMNFTIPAGRHVLTLRIPLPSCEAAEPIFFDARPGEELRFNVRCIANFETRRAQRSKRSLAYFGPYRGRDQFRDHLGRTLSEVELPRERGVKAS